MRSRRLFTRLVLVLAATLAACGNSGDGDGSADALSSGGSGRGPLLGHDLVVMTRNLYVGADLFEPFLVDPDIAVTTALEVFQDIVASDVPGRMAAVADEIERTRPDVVGLQEAYRFVVTDLQGGDPVVIDFLSDLERALAERPRPLHYRRVAEQAHTVLTLPFVEQGFAVTLIDRDAILVDQDVHVSSSSGGNFDADFVVTLAGVIPVEQKRGWVEVAAKHHGDSFTFVNTHLEVKEFGPLQSLQAQELLALFGDTRPTILVGDTNSAPTDPPFTVPSPGGPVIVPTPYQILTSAFRDAWSETRGAPGFTCCFDADLAPPSRDLFERVDLVLFRGDLKARFAFRIGLEPLASLGDRWPSDHAGVVAILRFRDHGQGHGGKDDDHGGPHPPVAKR
jgi:endonuclease/exonuclease/phosphatase family metal-dependent hydrolase